MTSTSGASPVRSLHRARSAGDRADLHLVDLRVLQPEPAAARAEHRVRLVQRADPGAHASRRSPLPRRGRNSCSGGSSSRIVTGSPAIASKIPSKSDCWNGSSRSSAARRPALVVGEDHLLHDRQPLLAEEHVLGAAEADALGAELAGARGVLRVVGVRAHLQPAQLVGPAEDRLEVLVDLRRHERRPRRRTPRPVPPSIVITSPSRELVAAESSRRRRRATRPSQPATHGLPIPRATTAACEVMPPCTVRMPCAAIIPWMSSGVVSQRTRITGSPAFAALDGRVGVEDDRRRSRRPGEALRPLRDRPRAPPSGRSSGAAAGRAAPGRCARPPPRARSAPRRPSSTAAFSAAAAVRFADARLQQVEPLVLDGELDVLHVAVVLLEPAQRRRAAGRTPPASPRRIASTGCGVRMPATTSSPCAFARNSP